MVVAKITMIVLAKRERLDATLGFPIPSPRQELVEYVTRQERMTRVQGQPQHVALLSGPHDDVLQQVVILFVTVGVLEAVVLQPDVVGWISERHPERRAATR